MGWKNMDGAPKDEFILVKVISDDLDPKSELIQDIAILDSGFWTNQFGHVVEPKGWCLMPPIDENDGADDIIFSPFRACDVSEAWVISKVSIPNGRASSSTSFYCSHSSQSDEFMRVLDTSQTIPDAANMMRDYITKTCIADSTKGK